jgi:rhamnulokinase
VVTRGIVESLVMGTARVLDQLDHHGEVHVFGGAGRSSLYQQRLGEATGLPVVAGPVEATALGNALVQGMALGLGPARNGSAANVTDG